MTQTQEQNKKNPEQIEAARKRLSDFLAQVRGEGEAMKSKSADQSSTEQEDHSRKNASGTRNKI